MRACKRLHTCDCVTARSCTGVRVRAGVRVDMLLVEEHVNQFETEKFWSNTE